MPTKEEAFQKIKLLVQRFDEQKDSYKQTGYNETQTRRDFIDPFFKALGWDVDNEAGCAESYREVIHEDKVRVENATKAPDYSFRLSGGKRLFFVEAKKPSIVIKDDIHPAYQLRRYGWSAKLPISIITDFEELAVYDCTQKPAPTDKASTARIHYLTYDQYLQEFDFLWNTFSKTCVLKGSFDQFVLNDTYKKGTATVDAEFLQSLDIWRKELAQNIALRNTDIQEDILNISVQNTIDRIVFLRIAEDRHIEPYGNLQDVVKSGNYYQNLLYQFNVANEKYNAGIFDLQKDAFSSHLVVDNKVIKKIISDLYYPISPYEFSVLSVEILGSAYEQFLGKQIRLTKEGRAKIEEKPEVRKAGGVYYTPQYIVNYIVKNTIGNIISGKSPEEVSLVKILDPACGSGSFLIGAYQFLLDWHLSFYTTQLSALETEKPKSKHKLPLTPDGKLTTAEKKRILLNNIYGVDLDSNAVEVTKLSLLLKCMEGETEASINQQISLFHERILPSLDNNIKSGNSLIGIDFYENELDFDQFKKIKPFDWEKEFPEVFQPRERFSINEFKEQYQWVVQKEKEAEKRYETLIEQFSVKEPQAKYLSPGGFDVVIGNPPYVVIEGANRNERHLVYFREHFQSASYKVDLYHLFIEKGLNLLRTSGKLGFITPSNYLSNKGVRTLRHFILQNSNIEILNVINGKVFPSASVDTVLSILEKTHSSKLSKFITSELQENDLHPIQETIFDQTIFKENEGELFISTTEKKTFHSKTFELGTRYFVKFGMQLRDRKKFKKDVIPIESTDLISNFHRPCYTGKDVNKWFLNPVQYVAFFNRIAKRGGCWDENIHNAHPKIIVRQIGTVPICALEPDGFCCLNTVFMIVPKDSSSINLKFILALLNSSFTRNFWKQNFSDLRKTFPKIKGGYLEKIPIPDIDFSDKTQQLKHDEIIKTVDKILELNKQNVAAQLENDKILLQRQIDFCEEKIDQIVYELYQLSQDEILQIESNK